MSRFNMLSQPARQFVGSVPSRSELTSSGSVSFAIVLACDDAVDNLWQAQQVLGAAVVDAQRRLHRRARVIRGS